MKFQAMIKLKTNQNVVPKTCVGLRMGNK